MIRNILFDLGNVFFCLLLCVCCGVCFSQNNALETQKNAKIRQ